MAIDLLLYYPVVNYSLSYFCDIIVGVVYLYVRKNIYET